VQKGETIAVRDVFVDGTGVGDVGNVVLRDRQVLSENGIVVVLLQKGKNGSLTGSVDIVSRGFVYMADSAELITQATKLVKEELQQEHVKNWTKVKEKVERRLEKFFFKATGRKPMIVAFLINPQALPKRRKKSPQPQQEAPA